MADQTPTTTIDQPGRRPVERETLLSSEDMFQVWAALGDRAEIMRQRAASHVLRQDVAYCTNQAEQCERLAVLFEARVAVLRGVAR